jgi:hypothetical protein
MRTYQLQTNLWLPRPKREIFRFFSDPINLEKITPPWLRFEILSPSSLVVARGTRIDYRLRIRGLPIRWQSAITLWEPPLRFVDQQTPLPRLDPRAYFFRMRGRYDCRRQRRLCSSRRKTRAKMADRAGPSENFPLPPPGFAGDFQPEAFTALDHATAVLSLAAYCWKLRRKKGSSE